MRAHAWLAHPARVLWKRDILYTSQSIRTARYLHGVVDAEVDEDAQRRQRKTEWKRRQKVRELLYPLKWACFKQLVKRVKCFWTTS